MYDYASGFLGTSIWAVSLYKKKYPENSKLVNMKTVLKS